MAKICIYEDQGYENLLPLVFLKPVFELRCGGLTIYEKIRRLYPDAEIILLARDHLFSYLTERYPETSINQLPDRALFISGRALLHQKIEIDGEDQLFMNQSRDIVAFRGSSQHIKSFPLKKNELARSALQTTQLSVETIVYPWDLINLNPVEIQADFRQGISGKLDKNTTLYGNSSLLHLGEESRVEAGTVIDLTSGPVFIDEKVTIRGPGRIDGPCYIGKETIVDCPLLRPGCSFGPMCRIGGEVEGSIFQGYSNKHHRGFLGHSYVGEWVNLGAFTTNSDLKNNYSMIKVTIGNQNLNTGSLKIGCFIGDHSKTAIGTLINTGAVIGIFANVFNLKGISPKTISSFSWGMTDKYDIEKALETARVVMTRRKVSFTSAYEQLIRTVHHMISSQ